MHIDQIQRRHYIGVQNHNQNNCYSIATRIFHQNITLQQDLVQIDLKMIHF